MPEPTFTLDSDERGFTLRIRGDWDADDFGADIAIRLSYWDCVELHRALAPMRAWLEEAAAAKASMPPSREELEEIADPRGGFPLHERIWAQVMKDTEGW